MLIDADDYFAHYGTPRQSGRYPWGSGGNQEQLQLPRNMTLLDYIQDLKSKGMNDTEIARGLDISTTRYRALRSIAKNEQKQARITTAYQLREKGVGNTAGAKQMGIPESSFRALLAEGEKEKADKLQTLANVLKDQVDKKQMLDVGLGVEHHIGVSSTQLATAVQMLREQGYGLHKVKQTQAGTGLDTEYKVLASPGITQKDVFLNKDKIQQYQDYSDDGSNPFRTLHPPIKINTDRVKVIYAEDGGALADGVLYIRPGVKDVELGNSMYAQVRVAVGDGHYLKGMAMYKNDLPDGVDIAFNSNKSKKDVESDLDAMKPNVENAENPFGTFIRRQIGDKDVNGKVINVTSAMNIVNEEGDWGTWSKNIASQVLSKQEPRLAKNQLDMTYESRKQELAEIMSLTNPTVRKKLLEEFADSADAAAVHLKAAALPRQGWHAILPINSLPPNQIYAPNFNNGETVVLIRYPHGGTFEIPELVVNNKHPEARKLLGLNPRDAVGIHASVAERLSGADFDGDTVLVIPNGNKKLISTPALAGLKNFNPKLEYPGYPGMKIMSNTQQEMGSISNLITDMTIKGAKTEDLARAIRHSMVVIDAEKKELNHKESYKRNNIRQLKEKYQSQPGGGSGASTIISRAKSEEYIPDRKERLAKDGGPIDPVTGKKVYQPTGRINYKTGNPKLTRVTRLAETDDAHTLSSGIRIEKIYGDHSNRLKTMANQARLAVLSTPTLKYSPSAKKAYPNEVNSLNAQLALAIRNKPLERQAQLIQATMVKAMRTANPNMDAKTLTKVKFLALDEARNRVGAKKTKIKITPEEWNAIQAGAISNDKLTQILDNADMDVVRALATPRNTILMTSTKKARAQAMLSDGYTRTEVAGHLGVSLTTLDSSIGE